ncbi:xanthine dehydrogenase family protein molybdopterin-binding subunit [Phenylobacterium sp. LjRoot219]|uniref:molybdopterin cofactor-binding domain-containing protein n=1 Tax=Phenylobacterium sp. LjRoot219 TaxID=3342283 RepID=UPI003ECC9405
MPDLAPGYARNILDEDRQGVLGRPLPRIDGPLKVTGQATYAYEYAGQGEAAYGMIVGAGVPAGRVVAIDTTEAARIPGVLLVMTHLNAPQQADYVDFPKLPSPFAFYAVARPFLADGQVRYHGEPVAFVVAETFEVARDAAARVKVTYEAAPFATRIKAKAQEAYAPKTVRDLFETDTSKGDFAAAFAGAAVQLDATYETPIQHHNAIEPNSSMAVWDGDVMTVYSASQLAMDSREVLASTLKLPQDKVRVICKFVGGGFGGKLSTEADAILSALAARQLGQPVKTALLRQQTFVNAGHRTDSIQRVRLGADRDGRLVAMAHEALMHTATFDEFTEQTTDFARHLYAAPNRLTTHRLVKLDLPMPGDMRAPGEAIGMLAMEQAMDELAYATGLDPIELRVRNEPTVHPETGQPFSTRQLVACYREGAKRFGWDQRPTQPASRREGRWLIGYGMSASIRSTFMAPSEARVKLAPDGRLTVQTAMTDIGTGTYTILGQIAAEAMGLPLDSVTVEIGDSDLPPAPGSGGSWGAGSSGSGVFYACMALRDRMAKAAGLNDTAELQIHDAQVTAGGRTLPLKQFLATHAPQGLEAEGQITPGKEMQDYSQASYGATFAEMAVDIDTGEPRLRRMLGVFTAGRILNAQTARSQAIGGLIWGLGSALHEETAVDEALGRFINNDLAGYHFPAHADAVNVDAIFLPELDDKSNPLKSKGVGELAICGSGGAIANAIYNACGVRVRSYPITLDKLILDPAFPAA